MRHTAVALALFTTLALSAATFDLPSDAALLERADVVVVATVLDSSTREASDRMVLTDHRLQIEQVLKGHASGTIVVSEAGGFANGHGVVIPGAPQYQQGTRVLTFLRQRADGTYYTAFMGLGKYRFDRRGDVQLLVREAEGIETLTGNPADVRDAQAFVDAIRTGRFDGAPRVTTAATIEREPESHILAASSYVFIGSPPAQPFPIRWAGCEANCTINYLLNGVQAGVSDIPGGVAAALAVWTNDPGSFVNLNLAGLTSTTSPADEPSDENSIILGYSGPNAGYCDASLGCGVVRFGLTHTWDGATWYSVEEADVTVNAGSRSQTAFETILAHEVGHSLAFKDAAGQNALMNGVVNLGRGAVLGRWDEEALAQVYGFGLPCSAVNISSTSGGGSVPFGSQRQLSVNVTGDSPRTFQWYEGTSGNTTTPVGTNSSTFTTPAITAAASYWVRVSNNCPSTANSPTITVTPAACDVPVISLEPSSQRIAPGTTATLQVGVNGTSPFTFQWYRASTAGDTSSPVGPNNSSFTTPVLNTTTSYWVRVSNNCGEDDSALATITVSATCVSPTISGSSPAVTLSAGQSTTLSVSAAGDAPFTYQWYRGEQGDQTNPVAGATNATFNTGPLTPAGTYKFWARVQNACGNVNSPAITITVTPTCVTPTIAQSSGNINVLLGDGATISVTPAGGGPYTYQWYRGASGDPSNPIAGANGPSYAAGPFNAAGSFPFWVLVKNACNQQVGSATITITVGCHSTVPIISAPAITNAVSAYDVSWTGVAAGSRFELQESTSPAFTASLRSFSVTNALFRSIPPHTEITIETRFYYRVRAISACTGQPLEWSDTTSTVVTPPLPANSTQFQVSVPEGTTQSFIQNYLVPGFGEAATNGDTFSITDDAPWLSVFPQSGALSNGGTTVQLTINPAGLGIGSKTATILVLRTSGAAAGRVASHGTTVTTVVPFGLSMVTPVSPDPRDGNPPPGTMIIPAVAHAQGIGSPFRSDVRIVNVSFEDIEYELSFTPSGVDGTEISKKTTITIRAGDTLAFDDIVSSWYGAGMLGESGLGTIEIRPLTSNNPLNTFASSRTYALDGGGTLGQFIPALRAEQFIGNLGQDPLNRISLQQVANSAAYRTNLGFVEGSGTPVSILARLRDGNNNQLAQFTTNLAAFGQIQRSFTSIFGDVALTDGRVEVEVTSPGGKVSAYASVLNNNTNDPLMVFPVQPARTTASRYVLAGIAEFVAADRNFHSDMRIYNGGTTTVTASLEYYERGQSTPLAGTSPVQIVLAPGQVRAINDVLPTLWNLSVNGGSVVATAPAESSLVLTAQTYSREPDGGTKGQFIPGVTRLQSVGFGDRGLEVLQLEQSPLYRSNVGFVEVTGKPVVVEITAVEPDTKVSVVTSLELKANEYRQFDRILEQLGLGTVYNGRVNVKVINGEGRIYAYGSTIDNRTEDPTYVPGQ